MEFDEPAAGDLSDIFIGDGEMAGLMRSHDWASTPLGPPQQWPATLKVALRLLLTSRFEMWLGWGPDIAFFYNDAYRPTLGIKHPQSLAMPTKELWPEIWDDIEPRLRKVYEEGEATWDRALRLILARNGYPEETYHTFSYSPLIGDSGKVEGVFCAVTEETDRVITERRLGTLRELASGLAFADTRGAVLEQVEDRLRSNGADLTFSLTYLFGPDGSAHLAAATGIPRHHPCALDTLPPKGGIWDLAPVWSGDTKMVRDLCDLANLPTGEWDQPSNSAAIVPLIGQGSDKPMGAMIVGLNPFRPYDAVYEGFLSLIAGQIASSLANAEAHESEKRRVAALAEAAQLREQAAEALRRANEHLTSEIQVRTEERDRIRELFRQAPSFMCILSGPEHRFQLVNEAYLQLVGHRDLVGLSVREALPEVEGQGYFEVLDEVFESGEAFVGRSMPVEVRRTPDADAELRYVHLVYQPIRGADGQVTGIFVDGYDVTDQREAEEALKRFNETLEARIVEEIEERRQAEIALQQAQKMDTIGKLTGGVAHDFNNLLQVVSGNLQLLARDLPENEKAQRRVGNALAGVERGAKLASQLLAFGRRQPLEPKVVNIGRFVTGMEEMLRRTIGEAIEIDTIVRDGLWNTFVDPAQVENALLNLAINARDAMDGHGRLTVELGNSRLDDVYVRRHADASAGDYVVLAVTDTGSGMTQEVLEQVFEPFFSTKPEGKGTGLGLSMVYGFARQSGGHVTIYSEVGEGTTVKLYLPRAMAEEERIQPTESGEVPGGSETILVAEDDDEVRSTVIEMLGELGYSVLTASDAAGALAIVESGVPIDLLFTDVVMPGAMKSPDLARRIGETRPEIRVLFTSGYTEDAIVHGGRLDEGVELLSKPYTREALARKVRQVLDHKGQLEAA